VDVFLQKNTVLSDSIEVIEKTEEEKENLIFLLQQVQEEEGYVSQEAMRNISQKLRLPLSEIYGVATFYSQFRLKPRGENIIRVCQGTACHVLGGKRILEVVAEELKVEVNDTTEDGRFTLETVACLGSCSLAPVMVINEETYGRLTPETVKNILRQF